MSFNIYGQRKKDNYVLVNSEFGYGIINQKTHMIPCVSDEEEEIAIKKMLEVGNRVYEDINEALSND